MSRPSQSSLPQIRTAKLLAQASRQVAEELHANVGPLAHQLLQIVTWQHRCAHRGTCQRIRRVLGPHEQGDLSETLTGTDRADGSLAIRHQDLNLALEQQIGFTALVTSREDRLPLGKLGLPTRCT